MTDTVYLIMTFENRQRRQDESIKFYDNYKVENKVRLLRTKNKKRLDLLLKLIKKAECRYGVFPVGVDVTPSQTYLVTAGKAYVDDWTYPQPSLERKRILEVQLK